MYQTVSFAIQKSKKNLRASILKVEGCAFGFWSFSSKQHFSTFLFLIFVINFPSLCIILPQAIGNTSPPALPAIKGNHVQTRTLSSTTVQDNVFTVLITPAV